MTNEAIQQLITSWFPNVEFTNENNPYVNVTVTAEDLHPLMTKLKEDTDTNFDYLFCLTGIDWGKELGVIYHLESTKHRHIIVVRVKTSDRENPNFDTVSNIWQTANFHEREAYDFFGIKFNNHPNLKRLFLTDEWDGFPMRKDYVDDANMVIK